jgi:hypothetical protein
MVLVSAIRIDLIWCAETRPNGHGIRKQTQVPVSPWGLCGSSPPPSSGSPSTASGWLVAAGSAEIGTQGHISLGTSHL